MGHASYKEGIPPNRDDSILVSIRMALTNQSYQSFNPRKLFLDKYPRTKIFAENSPFILIPYVKYLKAYGPYGMVYTVCARYEMIHNFSSPDLLVLLAW